MSDDVLDKAATILKYIALIVAVVLLIAVILMQLPLDSIELTKRTGWLEIIGWSFALALAIIGLRLAWHRTDAIKSGLEETRKSHALTLQSIEATKRQIEIAAAAAEHDTETEMRKQFREACSNLSIENSSSTRYALEEISRLAKCKPTWFATAAVRVLEGFWNNPDCKEQLLIIDCLSRASAILSNPPSKELCPDFPTSAQINHKEFAGVFYDEKLNKIAFNRCSFNTSIFLCQFNHTKFFGCRFSGPKNPLSYCSLIGATFHLLGADEKKKADNIHIDTCNLTDAHFNAIVENQNEAESYPSLHIHQSNITEARFDIFHPVVNECWYWQTPPDVGPNVEQEFDVFDAKHFTPLTINACVGPIFQRAKSHHSPSPTA